MRFFLIFICIALFVVFDFSSLGLGFVNQDPMLPNKDISLAVLTAEGVLVQSNPQGVELKTVKVIAKAGDSLQQLLKAHSIFPDAEAFGLVYDLNPTLQSAASIKEGSELVLPTVAPKDSHATLVQGQFVALTVDSHLKTALAAKIESLSTIITATIPNRLAAEHFTDPDERQSTLRSLRDINDSLTVIGNVIKGKVRPISTEVLYQVTAEAELLQSTLEKFLHAEGKYSADSLTAIKLIDEDLKIKRRTLTDVRSPDEPPTRWREVLVVVKTLGQDGRQISNLRIYYVPEALRSQAQFIRSFDTLSSPSQRSMPEANYLIWAGKPGQETAAAALSDVKKLPLRKTSDAPLAIELAIIR